MFWQFWDMALFTQGENIGVGIRYLAVSGVPTFGLFIDTHAMTTTDYSPTSECLFCPICGQMSKTSTFFLPSQVASN